MNYATIKYYDIANGPGVRTSVFVSGCRHHCPGCFNEVAWDFGYGKPFDKATRKDRKSTRLNSSHWKQSRMPSSA